MVDESTEARRPNDSTDEEMNGWIRAVSQEMGADRLAVADRAFCGVAKVLCEHLSPDAADRLVAELPLGIRARIHGGASPPRNHAYTRRSFMAMVDAEMNPSDECDPESVTHAVLKVMSQRIAPQEAEALRDLIPADLQGLWTGHAASSTNGIWSKSSSDSDLQL